MPLGPGIPDPPAELATEKQNDRHHLGERLMVRARSALGGLHNEYWVAAAASRLCFCGRQLCEIGQNRFE
jgi:hypothetical protein